MIWAVIEQLDSRLNYTQGLFGSKKLLLVIINYNDVNVYKTHMIHKNVTSMRHTREQIEINP